ncbi:hypothetical protein [Spiroplasma taiwanense]|uniref:Transmembrane protein n=1 Tax=Spiroplasma taiwanense CT-1 TaxID=1276220 RepID=S5MCF4_9MOLU|nr:hypothetical protein [Spiroplasma taiwanense]AGR41413.1 hypothetical protein STAIW_v1c08250 [Spiroplasma taiwanense CT-1]
MQKTNRLIAGKMGDMFTKRFLKSRNVNMVSEGDYLARLRCLCRATYSLPVQFLFTCFFIYARVIVEAYFLNSQTNSEITNLLIVDQINVLNVFIVIQLYHIFILSSVIIVMLNMTLGRGTTIFTALFNVLYLSEALLYGSFLFILDWTGLLYKFSNPAELLLALSTQWLWLFAIIIAMWSFSPLRSIFKDVNMWNREWIRVDRYRKTEDRENAFIFKTWVTPGEISARNLMIVAAWFCIFTASAFHLMDIFASTGFNSVKYVILIFGYIVFLAAYVVPYNKISLIFYWTNQIFLFSLFTYGLYMIQNEAWIYSQWYLYLYILLIIPWALSLRSAIKYTWTLKDKEEIKAIVLNMFDEDNEFEKFIEERNEVESETTI